MCMCVHACMRVCVCMRACMVHVYVCVCLCMYACEHMWACWPVCVCMCIASSLFTWPWSSRQVGRLRWNRYLQCRLPPDVRTTLPIRAGPCLSWNFLSSCWIVSPPSSRMLLDSTPFRRSRLGCRVHTITSAWGNYYIWSKYSPCFI